jgi:hypothetical protein
MVETGYSEQKNVIFPSRITDKVGRNVEAAIYSGRLVIKGTTDADAKPADCLHSVIGWSGFEMADAVSQPANISTAYAVGASVPVCNAPGNPVFSPLGLAPGFIAEQGDLLIPWGVAGQVAPAIKIGGGYGVKIPFSKNTSEKDTGIDLPAGILVRGWAVNVATAASGATLDAGILSTETGGDTDGFIDGASLASTGLVFPGNVDATAANNTLGVLLVESDIKSADTTALYLSMPTPYKTDGTAKSIVYLTSDHNVSGFFYLVVESPGIEEVGKTKYKVDATAGAANITVVSMI